MQIQILNVSVETKSTKTGKSYQQADVAYKNLTFQGKVEGKKLMSFGAQEPAFKALANAQAGSTFEITVVKNAAGYNDWVAATSSNGVVESAGAAQGQSQQTYSPKAATIPVKSSYETPEERAKKQIFIIRQSNLSSAINLLSIGSKSPPKVDEVLEVAKQFEGYVLGVQAPVPDASGFDNMDDDIPL